MWVVLQSVLPLGQTPLNRFYKIIAAIFAAILCTVVFNSSAYAADASWQNNAIKYGETTLNGPKKAQSNSPLKIPEGSEYYESSPSSDGKVTVIYFTPGTDIEQATGAQVAEYKFSAPDTYVQQGSPKTISIDKKSESNSSGENGENSDKEVTACAVNQLGYIICPLMSLMANMTDRFYGYLQTLLEVKPILSDRESPLFQAWSMMLTMANVAFVIAFLVVVYSYTTSYGINQYDIRRMVPRIVVAALLVNISYYICSLLVDVSNIIGGSLQDMLLNLRQDMMQNQTMNEMSMPTWTDMIAYGLSGGALAVVGALNFSAGGNIWLAVPVLTVVILALFVTVAVLAARQALIVILIVISPLAFVAFVLPGTQKYFDKWRDVFQTMLLMYPMFSLLFGGSQLAGYIIAQTADRFEVLLIAMFVSMAPLVITPFLIRFSGSLLGKFAGMINNPAKGVLDRSKNWAQDNRDLKRAERLADNARFSGLARWNDDRKRLRQGRKSIYDAKNNASFMERSGRGMMIEQWRADERTEAAENANRSAYAELKYRDRSMQLEEAGNRLQKQMRTVNEGRVEAMMSELKTKEGERRYSSENVALAALSNRMQDLHEQEYVVESRKAAAQSVLRSDMAQNVISNDALQRAAAGIGGEKGKAVATARAITELYKDFGEGEAAVGQLMSHFKLSGADINQLANRSGAPIVKTKPDGTSFTFDFNDDYTFSAAVDKLINEKGNTAQKIELIKKSGLPEYADVRSTIMKGAAKTLAQSAPQFGGRSLDIIETTGVDPNNADAIIAQMGRDFIVKGKFSQSVLAGYDADALRLMYEAIKDGGNYDGVPRNMRLEYDANRAAFIEQANKTLNNPQINNNIRSNTKAVLQQIAGLNPLNTK